MSTESRTVSATLPARPADVYAAWLDSYEHGEMTGGPASIDPSIGGRHSEWGGYITGATLELDAPYRIVQSWRSSDFPKGAPDSRIEVTFDPEGGGTRIVITHTEIPEGQGASYESGWSEHYFEPMARYFGSRAPSAPKPAPAQKPAAAAPPPARKTAPAKKPAPKKAAPAKKPAAKKAVPKKAAKKARKSGAAKKAPAKKTAARKPAAKKAAKKSMTRKPHRTKAAGSSKKARRRAKR